jgi:hypothetical protein
MRVLDLGAKAGFIRDCIERWITADMVFLVKSNRVSHLSG